MLDLSWLEVVGFTGDHQESTFQIFQASIFLAYGLFAPAEEGEEGEVEATLQIQLTPMTQRTNLQLQTLRQAKCLAPNVR